MKRSTRAVTILMLAIFASQFLGCTSQVKKRPTVVEKKMTEMEELEIEARNIGFLKEGGVIDKAFGKDVFAMRNPGGECPVYAVYTGSGLGGAWSSNFHEKGWNYHSFRTDLSVAAIQYFGKMSYLQLVRNSIPGGRNGRSTKRVLAVDIDSIRSLDLEKKLIDSGVDFNVIPVGGSPESQVVAKNIVCAKNPQQSWQAFKTGRKALESADCSYNSKDAYDAKCMLGSGSILILSNGKSATTFADMLTISKDQELPDVNIEGLKLGAPRRLVEQRLSKEVCKSMGGWIKCEASNDFNAGSYFDEYYKRYCKSDNYCMREIEEKYGFRMPRKVYYGGVEVIKANLAFENERLALIAIELRDVEAAKSYLTRTAGAPRVVTDYQVESKSIHTVRPIMIGQVASVEHDFYPTQQVRTTRIYQWSASGYYAEMEGSVLTLSLVDAR